MRSLACFVLAVAAPLAFSTGCAKAKPAASATDYEYSGPPVGWRDPSVGKETRSTAMVVTGAVVWATVESCPVTDDAERCGEWTHDASLGPLLMVHGAGPLSIGLTYLISAALHSDVEVALHAGDGATSVSVRGRL